MRKPSTDLGLRRGDMVILPETVWTYVPSTEGGALVYQGRLEKGTIVALIDDPVTMHVDVFGDAIFAVVVVAGAEQRSWINAVTLARGVVR